MDARITKSRLANMLSYDWLKIIATVAVAVLAICVFFTTVSARPGRHQIFTVYAYRELLTGGAAEEFLNDMEEQNIFSFDVLKVTQEAFGTGQYSDAAFMARRSAGEGTVMFLTENRTSEEDPSVTVMSELLGGENHRLALDLDLYFEDCEKYLVRFFGEKWREGELDKAEAEACFSNRLDGDRRFRSEEKRAAGVLQEYDRLEQLREDYLYVEARLAEGLLPYRDVTDDKGVAHHKAFSLAKLSSLRSYFYYTETTTNEETKEETTVASSANICLFFFRNDEDEGKEARYVQNDLRYEPVSYLRALIERFA